MVTRELVLAYQQAQREYKELDKKFDRLSHKRIPAEHGTVRGSMKDFPYAEAHFVISGSDITSDEEYKKQIRQMFIDLQGKRKLYESLENELANQIELIEDAETRKIFALKYLYGCTDKQIADRYGLERSTITKRLGKVFD